MPIDDAIELPNLIARGATYGAELGKFPPGVVDGLAAKGVKLGPGNGAEGSGLHGIEVTPNGLRGGADSRREGVAKRLLSQLLRGPSLWASWGGSAWQAKFKDSPLRPAIGKDHIAAVRLSELSGDRQP